MKKKAVINAAEKDGFITRNCPIHLEVMEWMGESQVLEAIIQASMEYCATAKEGKDTFAGNNNHFNYGDFATYVPNSICTLYGIQKMEDTQESYDVVFDTQLVAEEDLKRWNDEGIFLLYIPSGLEEACEILNAKHLDYDLDSGNRILTADPEVCNVLDDHEIQYDLI